MNMHTDPNALFQQAISFHRQGQLHEAAAVYRQVIAVLPAHPAASAYLGMLEFQRGNLADAVQLLQQALDINPDQLEASSFLGAALLNLERAAEALAVFDRVLALRPGFAEALVSRGMALRDLGRLEEALAAFDQALAAEPGNCEVLNNRALALQSLNRADEALASVEQAIGLRPDLAVLHSNRGNVLLHFRRFDEALASYEHALRLDPGYADAWMNKGNVLLVLGRNEAALDSYDRALERAPGSAEAWLGRGNALLRTGDAEAAVASLDRAISGRPAYAPALVARGDALRKLKRLEEAAASYKLALEARPDFDFLRGRHFYARMQLCDWTGWQEEVRAIEAGIARGARVADPFHALSVTGSAALCRQAAETYAQAQFAAEQPLPGLPRRTRRDKIRLGYFSADFRNHPVSLLAAELFELHDRARFEVIAFSFDPDGGDAFTVRLITAFDQFIEVRDHSDRDIAERARAMEIDIAIDLGGYTQNSRTGVFAMRAAPLQVSFLGYPGTMGAPFIDYLLADPVVIPEAARRFYVEKIAALPHSYLPHDRSRAIGSRTFSRRELGLPERGFVFCSFNGSYKINPMMFDVWMRILQRVEGSVLWMSRASETAMRNLKAEAEVRGVSAERIVFAQMMPSTEDHLARLRSADLFLDALPYGAHTTAGDALWAGVPLLTCSGENMAGRAATSLLAALGAPELVTANLEAYEARACELAARPDILREIRDKLARNRLKMPAFDTPLYVRHIEAAYAAMYERYLSGQAPEHISIQP